MKYKMNFKEAITAITDLARETHLRDFFNALNLGYKTRELYININNGSDYGTDILIRSHAEDGSLLPVHSWRLLYNKPKARLSSLDDINGDYCKILVYDYKDNMLYPLSLAAPEMKYVSYEGFEELINQVSKLLEDGLLKNLYHYRIMSIFNLNNINLNYSAYKLLASLDSDIEYGPFSKYSKNKFPASDTFEITIQLATENEGYTKVNLVDYIKLKTGWDYYKKVKPYVAKFGPDDFIDLYEEEEIPCEQEAIQEDK